METGRRHQKAAPKRIGGTSKRKPILEPSPNGHNVSIAMVSGTFRRIARLKEKVRMDLVRAVRMAVRADLAGDTEKGVLENPEEKRISGADTEKVNTRVGKVVEKEVVTVVMKTVETEGGKAERVNNRDCSAEARVVKVKGMDTRGGALIATRSDTKHGSARPYA